MSVLLLRLLRLRLAVLATFLVHGPCGAFLGLVVADAAFLVRLLDVLVLALAFRAGSCRHGALPGGPGHRPPRPPEPAWADRRQGLRPRDTRPARRSNVAAPAAVANSRIVRLSNHAAIRKLRT